jgi:hypothetical protein
MKTEEFNKQLNEIDNLVLIEKAKISLSRLCETGGKSFTMSVPVRLEDTDVILSEIIKRFEKIIS